MSTVMEQEPEKDQLENHAEVLQIRKISWQPCRKPPNAAAGSLASSEDMSGERDRLELLLQEMVEKAGHIATREGTAVISPAHLKEAIASDPEKFKHDKCEATLAFAVKQEGGVEVEPPRAMELATLDLLQQVSTVLQPVRTQVMGYLNDYNKRDQKKDEKSSHGSSKRPRPEDAAPIPEEPVKLDYFKGDPLDEEATALALMVPDWAVATVIGKKGQTINQIESTTGSKVAVQAPADMVPGQRERRILLTGSIRNTSIAQYLVNLKVLEKMASESGRAERVAAGGNQVKILVPNAMVSKLIGKKGATIGALQQESGATTIQVEKEGEMLAGVGGRMVTIHGGSRARNVAQYLISRAIMAHQANDNAASGGSGRGDGSVTESSGGGFESNLFVPNTMIARLIGKGGATISEIQGSFDNKIQIQIHPPNTGPGNSRDTRTVTLRGADSAIVAQCVTSIQSRMTEWASTPALNQGHGKTALGSSGSGGQHRQPSYGSVPPTTTYVQPQQIGGQPATPNYATTYVQPQQLGTQPGGTVYVQAAGGAYMQAAPAGYAQVAASYTQPAAASYTQPAAPAGYGQAAVPAGYVRAPAASPVGGSYSYQQLVPGLAGQSQQQQQQHSQQHSQQQQYLQQQQQTQQTQQTHQQHQQQQYSQAYARGGYSGYV